MTLSQNYINREEAEQSKPVEIFHFFRADNSEHWRYTSYDTNVVVAGNTYERAVINRGSVQYDPKLEISTLDIYGLFTDDPLFDYIAENPIEVIWVEVTRIHAGFGEGASIFIGQIAGVSLRGGQNVQVRCVGFEFHLKQQIPYLRYQPRCNHFIYDSIVNGMGCGVDKDLFEVTATPTLSDGGTTLTHGNFGGFSDGYFTLGFIEWNSYKRMIIEHSGNVIKIRYRIPNLSSGQQIKAYPGCDGKAETCEDKFNNTAQRFAFDYIPVDNPATKY